VAALLALTARSFGVGTIAGTVVNEANNPVENAAVGAFLTADPNVHVGAMTDASGSYTLTDLAAGTYTVKMIALGFAFAGEPNIAVADGGSTTVSFRAVKQATVAGHTTREDPNTSLGGALVSMTVQVNGVDFYPSASSDANTGEYTITNLPAGTWTVKAILQGFAFAPVQVSLSAGQAATGVDLSGANSWVSGLLAEWGGLVPLPGVFVGLDDANGHSTGCIASTDEYGSFLLGPVAEGTYRLTFRLDGIEVSAGEEVVLPAYEVTYAGIVEAFGGAVEGIVRDTTSGVPLPGARVSLSGAADSELPMVVVRCAQTDPNGRYVLGSLPSGSYDVRAYAAGHVAGVMSDIEVADGETTSAPAFDLPIGGAISGTVCDPNGNPLPNAVVGAFWDPNVGDPNDPNRLLPLGAVTDPNGMFTIIGCATGTYRRSALASRSRLGRRPAGRT